MMQANQLVVTMWLWWFSLNQARYLKCAELHMISHVSKSHVNPLWQLHSKTAFWTRVCNNSDFSVKCKMCVRLVFPSLPARNERSDGCFPTVRRTQTWPRLTQGSLILFLSGSLTSAGALGKRICDPEEKASSRRGVFD